MDVSEGMDRHSVAAVPVYRWRGAQPFPLDLGETDTGTAICLLLHREGDVCLVPISWQANVPPVARTHLNFRADALDGEALRLTLAELGGEGWAVIGRLEVRFTGRFALDEFWAETLAGVWQPPGGDSTPPGSDHFLPDC